MIVGLGNPGFCYRNTRHNIGFKVLETFAKKHGIRVGKKGYHGRYGIGRVAGREIMLLEPLTYMNLSGDAVEAVCSSRSVHPKEIIVIVDDINLPFGTLRVRSKGSAGGHNGLKSIIGKIGPEFDRLRVGIGRDGIPEDRAGYVLSSFSGEERLIVKEMIPKAVECVEIWIKSGINDAMALFN